MGFQRLFLYGVREFCLRARLHEPGWPGEPSWPCYVSPVLHEASQLGRELNLASTVLAESCCF